MSLFKKLFTGEAPYQEQRVDYFSEARALQRSGHDLDAVTSLRLALRDDPNSREALQELAMLYQKTNQPEEAIRAWRHLLALDPQSSGAHYALAFLLLRRGMEVEAGAHLDAFLSHPPDGADAGPFVEHARETLFSLRSPADQINGGFEEEYT